MSPTFDLFRAALFFHVIGVAMWLGGMFANAWLAMRLGKATDWAERSTLVSAIRTIETRSEHPAMLVVLASGILMIMKRAAGMEPWLHPKLTLVFIAAAFTVVATIMNGKLRGACEDQDQAAFTGAHKKYMITGAFVPLGLLGSVFFVAFFR